MATCVGQNYWSHESGPQSKKKQSHMTVFIDDLS